MTYEQIRNEAIKLKADLADDPALRMGNALEQAHHFKQLAYSALGLIEQLAENLVPRGDLPKSGSFHSD